ncbi:MAG: hypothetical protein ABSF26_25535 [Thermoguttaceae bacterium]
MATPDLPQPWRGGAAELPGYYGDSQGELGTQSDRREPQQVTLDHRRPPVAGSRK